ncbi:unnamed protein product [Dovyalis caffra]|uniref:Uncharacterized protein n=1 Tax=Dovyalis caffra TaxID=77055 RepID=A0AAV1R5L3_9ROSI|nr:unnamed protein product [Dovyalis caffra]
MGNGSLNNSGGGDDLKKDQPPPFNNVKWGDLILNPDPENILAVGLTGLLAWASVQRFQLNPGIISKSKLPNAYHLAVSVLNSVK